jgi:uncharacterized membrane protein
MIIFHAAAGVISFAAGIFLLSPKRAQKHPAIFTLYLLSLIGLIIFMIGAMISHWNDISMTEQITFSGLVILGVYMLYRAVMAKRLLSEGSKQYGKYMDAIGFTLISLFDGFIIVGAIDLKFPGWIVAACAIGAVIIGNRFIKKEKAKFVKTSA